MPCAGSACHGGIARVLTFCLIALAHGRASAKESSDIGATSPGRWQLAHFVNMIGATSLVKVGALVGRGSADSAPVHDRWPASASDTVSPAISEFSFICALRSG